MTNQPQPQPQPQNRFLKVTTKEGESIRFLLSSQSEKSSLSTVLDFLEKRESITPDLSINLEEQEEGKEHFFSKTVRRFNVTSQTYHGLQLYMLYEGWEIKQAYHTQFAAVRSVLERMEEDNQP